MGSARLVRINTPAATSEKGARPRGRGGATARNGIDILGNAATEPAGFAGTAPLGEIGSYFFHAEMDTKVMGHIRRAREVAAGMR